MTEPDVTPESLARAMAELRSPPTFADFLDRHRPLVTELRTYLAVRDTQLPGNRKDRIVETARARLNAEADKLGLRWE